MDRVLILGIFLLTLVGCSIPEYYRPNVDADSILTLGGSCSGEFAYFHKEVSPGVLLLIIPPIYQLRDSPNFGLSVSLAEGRSFQLLERSIAIAGESIGEIELDIAGSRSNGERGRPVQTFGPLDRLEGSSQVFDRIEEWGVWQPEGDLFNFDIEQKNVSLGESFYLTPPLFSINGKHIINLPSIEFKRVKRGYDICFQ